MHSSFGSNYAWDIFPKEHTISSHGEIPASVVAHEIILQSSSCLRYVQVPADQIHDSVPPPTQADRPSRGGSPAQGTSSTAKTTYKSATYAWKSATPLGTARQWTVRAGPSERRAYNEEKETGRTIASAAAMNEIRIMVMLSFIVLEIIRECVWLGLDLELHSTDNHCHATSAVESRLIPLVREH
ncbi:hypothetical protein C8R44DRAFT_730352 [Mycena epipterygia]|nr:hypothetical protein C8R44DRAFT_730352 [Mycena epipterygia]